MRRARLRELRAKATEGLAFPDRLRRLGGKVEEAAKRVQGIQGENLFLQKELEALQLRITKVDSKLVEAQKSLREIEAERGRLMADSPTEHTGGRLGPMDEVEAIVRQLRGGQPGGYAREAR